MIRSLLIAAAMAAEKWIISQPAYLRASRRMEGAVLIATGLALVALDVFLSARSRSKTRKAETRPTRLHYRPAASSRSRRK